MVHSWIIQQYSSFSSDIPHPKNSLRRVRRNLCKLATRLRKRLAADISRALIGHTVVVPGTNTAVAVLLRQALQHLTLRKQRDEVALDLEQRVLAPVLTSMPGVAIRTAARLLTQVSCRAFASAAHLAACAGLAPVTRCSGSSIRGENPSRRGNKTLK